ncbi:MAG TPA: neutral zinc metallopeptidase, partial [Burkholderiaceae bacterium]|nr:neutral zinc metallopeptidase [Burkholderiaceae bacterium]
MKWEGNRESDNVEDARDSGGGGGFSIGGGRGIGLGTVVVALVAGWIFGINPITVLGLLSGGGQGAVPVPHQAQAPAHKPPAGDTL